MTRKLLPIMLLSAVSQTAIANSGCDTSNTVSGWGAWCGIETYLSQQEPTAAGPVNGLNSALSQAGLDGDEFGGRLSSLPLDTDEFDHDPKYQWHGYAGVSYYDTQGRLQQEVGLLQFNKNNATGFFKGEIVSKDGKKITFSSPKVRIFTGGNFSGVSDGNEIRVEHQFPYGQIFPGEIYSNKDQFGRGDLIAGITTNIADMNDLKRQSIKATYRTQIDYTDITGWQGSSMTVDFKNGSWSTGDMRSRYSGTISAKGIVEGNKFKSNVVQHSLYQVDPSSSLSGKFFGKGAESLGGNLDATINGKKVTAMFWGTQAK